MSSERVKTDDASPQDPGESRGNVRNTVEDEKPGFLHLLFITFSKKKRSKHTHTHLSFFKFSYPLCNIYRTVVNY